jgi:hypothetical protein
METTRLWFFIVIALVVLSVFDVIVVAGSGQDLLGNIVRLLFRH